MPARVTIKAIDGMLKGKEFVYEESNTCLLGRGEECGIKFAGDDSVSRIHSMIYINPPDAGIRDFGSLNGTFVNGKMIGQREEELASTWALGVKYPVHALKNGDKITLGENVLMLEVKMPIACNACMKEIPEEEMQYAISCNGSIQCRSCSGKTLKLDPSQLGKANGKCAKCGKNVGIETHDRKGVYLCNQCRSNPEELMKFLFESSGELEAGFMFQDYKIIKELGKGGMGAVYLAKDNRNGELVALKILIPIVAVNEWARKSFQREIDNMGLLDHRNIVKMKDTGFAKGTFYFTMEYCSGKSLDKIIGKHDSQMTMDEAIKIICQVLDGLEYAHNVNVPNVKLLDGLVGTAKGIVHRDLKPENIILMKSSDGMIAKIADFGISKSFEFAGFSGHTIMGGVAGTPYYMPRQQVINFKYSKPDVDIWAAAATLYVMLTGFCPRDFPQNVDPCKILLEQEPVPIGSRGVKLPQRLAEVIDQALCDKGNLKFQKAVDFKEALLSAL